MGTVLMVVVMTMGGTLFFLREGIVTRTPDTPRRSPNKGPTGHCATV
jgi:hypothetical protein